jgi:hypothetical protein
VLVVWEQTKATHLHMALLVKGLLVLLFLVISKVLVHRLMSRVHLDEVGWKTHLAKEGVWVVELLWDDMLDMRGMPEVVLQPWRSELMDVLNLHVQIVVVWDLLDIVSPASRLAPYLDGLVSLRRYSVHVKAVWVNLLLVAWEHAPVLDVRTSLGQLLTLTVGKLLHGVEILLAIHLS